MDDRATPYTYDQAAAALGIHPEAVRARLRRNALRRGPAANDGRPTVLLSPADIATIRASIRPQPVTAAPDAAPDAAGRPYERDRTIKALEGEVATLREALARERDLADKAEMTASTALAELATERTRAAVADAEAKAAREAMAREVRRLEQTEAALKIAETQRDAAQAAREATRVELATWTTGGPLSRALRALLYRVRS